jgi:hypothetical protein
MSLRCNFPTNQLAIAGTRVTARNYLPKISTRSIGEYNSGY